MFQEFPEDNKGDDFLNEFRQKIADQSSNNIEERRNEMKRSKSVFIGAVSGVVGLAGGMGGFILPIMFGAAVDLTGVRSSSFMLMFGTVCVSLICMHFSFRPEAVAEGQRALATSHH